MSNSLITDTYPIQARARIFAFEGVGRPIGQLLGPLMVGGIAVLIGGDDAWRWAYFILALPPVLLGIFALRSPSPSADASNKKRSSAERTPSTSTNSNPR